MDHVCRPCGLLAMDGWRLVNPTGAVREGGPGGSNLSGLPAAVPQACRPGTMGFVRGWSWRVARSVWNWRCPPIFFQLAGNVAITGFVGGAPDVVSVVSFFTSTFELRPPASYFSRRAGGKSSGVPSLKPAFDWK